MLRGKLPPSSYRSHPLPSGGPCEEFLHRLPIVATRCQAVDVARKTSTVWRTVATGERQLRENETNRSHPLPSGGPCEENFHRLPIVATRCQAVDVARKTSTVWRTVATGERWLREYETYRSHPLPSGGRCEENFHRLPIVATRCQAVDLARKISTVWRTVAT
jgi:hypothetical protein